MNQLGDASGAWRRIRELVFRYDSRGPELVGHPHIDGADTRRGQCGDGGAVPGDPEKGGGHDPEVDDAVGREDHTRRAAVIVTSVQPVAGPPVGLTDATLGATAGRGGAPSRPR